VTTACIPLPPWPLSRRGQELIAWDVSGLPSGATADLQLEGTGAWTPLLISTERDVLSVWAAGPSFTDPGDVLVVPTTSRTEIRIVAGQTTIFLDGGYIELVP